MNEQAAKALIRKYNHGTATPEERQLVESYYFRYLRKQERLPDAERLESDLAAVRANLAGQIQPAKTRRLWPRIAAAASILILSGIGGYLLLHHQKPVPTNQLAKNDVAPGNHQALLKMGYGRTVVLDSSKNGLIARQGNTTINQTAAGQLAYANGAPTTDHTAMVYDTLVNPAGAKVYHLKLADGSSFAVNAATTLRFPENFRGKERRIELLSGELYGEVVHHETIPFRVMAGGVLIEDIGTHFNISAYQDEPAKKITLLEGSVKVSVKGSSAVLKPGQQGNVGDNSSRIHVTHVDTEEATAWINGNFMFDGEDLGQVMRKISRWYAVEVTFENPAEAKKIMGGGITMYTNVSKVLEALGKAGDVHFKINGRKITVLNSFKQTD